LAACIAVGDKALSAAGLEIQLHRNGTAIEGKFLADTVASVQALQRGKAGGGTMPAAIGCS